MKKHGWCAMDSNPGRSILNRIFISELSKCLLWYIVQRLVLLMRSFNGLLSCANSVTFFLLAFMRKWTSHIFCFLIKMIRYCLPFSPTYYITSPILSLSFIYVHTNTQTLSIILSLLHTIIRLYLFLYILFLHFISFPFAWYNEQQQQQQQTNSCLASQKCLFQNFSPSLSLLFLWPALIHSPVHENSLFSFFSLT